MNPDSKLSRESILDHFRSGIRRQDETRSHMDWMIFVHSSELTSTATRELNQSVLSKLNIVAVMGHHLAYIVSTLLEGMLAQQISSNADLVYVLFLLRSGTVERLDYKTHAHIKINANHNNGFTQHQRR